MAASAGPSSVPAGDPSGSPCPPKPAPTRNPRPPAGGFGVWTPTGWRTDAKAPAAACRPDARSAPSYQADNIRLPTSVMAGLVPAIHRPGLGGPPWMPGTSPGMTDPKPRRRLRSCLPNRRGRPPRTKPTTPGSPLLSWPGSSRPSIVPDWRLPWMPGTSPGMTDPTRSRGLRFCGPHSAPVFIRGAPHAHRSPRRPPPVRPRRSEARRRTKTDFGPAGSEFRACSPGNSGRPGAPARW